jgi:hypothetical protein
MAKDVSAASTSTSEIAGLLSAEYLVDIDQASVDRLVSILATARFVSSNTHTKGLLHPLMAELLIAEC